MPPKGPKIARNIKRGRKFESSSETSDNPNESRQPPALKKPRSSSITQPSSSGLAPTAPSPRIDPIEKQQEKNEITLGKLVLGEIIADPTKFTFKYTGLCMDEDAGKVMELRGQLTSLAAYTRNLEKQVEESRVKMMTGDDISNEAMQMKWVVNEGLRNLFKWTKDASISKGIAGFTYTERCPSQDIFIGTFDLQGVRKHSKTCRLPYEQFEKALCPEGKGYPSIEVGDGDQQLVITSPHVNIEWVPTAGEIGGSFIIKGSYGTLEGRAARQALLEVTHKKQKEIRELRKAAKGEAAPEAATNDTKDTEEGDMPVQEDGAFYSMLRASIDSGITTRTGTEEVSEQGKEMRGEGEETYRSDDEMSFATEEMKEEEKRLVKNSNGRLPSVSRLLNPGS
ncbi:hypothetical protein ABW19_dt0204128 [Dactylella cylindrospora]|nr:hypothetical protein ABW19_dt0204128 [Dactylella cylindrospora]